MLEEEANEDFSKLSGLGEEEPLFDTPLRAIRRRLPWLGLNLITTSLSASVIGLFQGTIQSMALAAALMTIVAAQGGNAGVQTLTVMVRGMALGKVSMAQARGILIKELAVACGNGVALGIAAGVVTYVLHGQPLLATVLGLALAVNFLIAALVGSLIPLIVRACCAPIPRWRPVCSSPPARTCAASWRFSVCCRWACGIRQDRSFCSASSLVTEMSKILCIRTSSNSARTGLVISHSFRSPPLAFT